ncbi:MAG: formyltransferase [Nitrospirae bacterium]|nr:formyltransferase [Nitrospirota bacterium]
MMSKPAILVFAYHDVGYECLDALIQNDEYILAVITHKDDPEEEIWFRSVAALARKYDIPVHSPESVYTSDWIERIRSWTPDLILSFYYRNMIHEDILSIPRLGAFNMHGSLLPKYRGRAPINWAILNGERSTGVTLHHMVKQADAGDIVDQEAVPIGPEDTARDVFGKCVKAARLVIERQIGPLTSGTAQRRTQDESQATKFVGRKPEDGRIDWTRSADEIYNLVRAVTQPYPGAFTMVNGKKLLIWWATPRKDAGEKPGTITSSDPLVIATGSGSLEVVNYEWENEDEGELNVRQVLGT